MRSVAWVWLVLAVVVAWRPAHAGGKSEFDVMAYTAPAGWTAATANGQLTLRAIDEKTKSFGLIIVNASAASTGSLDKDFNAAWAAQIVPTFKPSGKPQMTVATSEDGWEAKSGSATGDASGVTAAVILVTMTGHGRVMNIIVTTNAEKYSAPIDAFLSSVKLDKVKAAKLGIAAPAAPATTDTPAAPAGTTTKDSNGLATTKFDDGWTARADKEWVEATKGTVTVRLHYGYTIDDTSRENTAAYFWKKLITPRYTVSNAVIKEWSPVDSPYYIGQADATDNASKVKGFVMLRVITQTGVAYCVEVFAPSRDAINKEFADQDKVAAIRGANRFAVGKDIAGTWASTTTSAIDMYYTSTGGYAGMNAAAIADKFVFSGNGKYSSEHKGATGMVGSQKAFQVKYAGTWTVAPWELTVKKKDGTTVYSAYYEAVRNGRVLHLTDKKYSGNTFTLAKTAK